MGQTYKGFQKNIEEMPAFVLALTFSHVLKNWLTKDEILQVIFLNEQEISSGICHTHDFCDANQAMIDAFIKLFNCTPEMQNDNDVDIINAAWEMAKKERFYTVI